MILKHEGLVLAEQVIDKLNGKLKDAGLEEYIMIAEAFDNCREQGLCFRIPSGEYIAIVNDRVTDSLVVYNYGKTQFPSNLPLDGHWNTIPVYKSSVEQAANSILARIKENLTCV